MIAARSARVSVAALAAIVALVAGCSDTAEPPADATLALALVTGGLDRPIFVTAPPGDTGRLFIAEQTGRIRIARHDSLLAAVFLDLTSLITCCGERGLLGLAFHPQYASNGFFYVNYTDAAGDTRVVRYHVSANPDSADPASASLVLSQAQPFSNHNGGMLAFGPDGYLYIGLGDGGSGGDPQGNGQNPATWLGKMLRISVGAAAGYSVPGNNPFIAQAGTRPEIWSLGLRNPWRYSFDRLTGELYIGDVGQGQREEVDVEPAGSGGRNYGWNVMEGDICFQSGCSGAGLTPPAHSYSHADGCSVNGGYVYRGTRIPALRGHYFYADYCDGWVRSFRWSGGAATDHRDWPALAPGGAISSFGEDAAGELYVVRYGAAGAGEIHRFIATSP